VSQTVSSALQQAPAGAESGLSLDPLGPLAPLGPPSSFPDLRLFKRVPKAIQALLAMRFTAPVKLARALRRGITRFVTNTRLHGAAMVAHVLNTNARAMRAEQRLVVAHDTSEIDRHGRGAPKDAGPLRSSEARGYLLHLAVASSLSGRLFGAISALSWTRSWDLRQGDHHSRPVSDRESRKWERGIEQAEKRLRAQGFTGDIFHVADREADLYRLLANQQQKKRHLIVRRDHLGRPRKVEAVPSRRDKTQKTRWIPLQDKLDALAFQGSYTVEVDSRRTDRQRGLTHQVRTATVHFRFCEVRLQPPSRADSRGVAKDGLTVWLVEVKERQPPPGVEPLHWQLLSVDPVTEQKQAIELIEIYRLRWKCEDYIKVTKSGCQLETQHVDTLASFKRLLALSLATANQLVQVVAASREQSPPPLEQVMTPQTIEALRDTADYHRVALPPGPITVPQALQAVARIGGFEWCEGRQPGWLVLTRGWMRVLEHQAIVAHERQRRRNPP
jgi:hypothetical protein